MKRSTKTGVSAGSIAILLGLTSVLSGLQSANTESCELKVDFAHISTYANETGGQKKIKIKARTECTKVQKYSVVEMKFYEVTKNGDVPVRIFDPKLAMSDKKRPENAYFESFEEFCVEDSQHKYFGKASGNVRMKSGKLIKVSGVSDKSITLRCGIAAQ